MSARPTNAAAITPRRVRWLWSPYVPCGKITAVAGQMGQAKSLWTLWLAANVTRSGLNLHQPGSALILTAEDDPEDTTVPRLMAAGADRKRIDLPDDLTLDAEALRARCDQLGDVRLVVFDPLAAYFGQAVNSWKTQHVRRALEPVRRFAGETGIAVVVVQHLNRGDSPDALARIADSQGIPQLARSVLVWGPSPDDPEGNHGSLKVLTSAKANLARGVRSVAFRIEEVSVGHGIRAARVVQQGDSDAQADDVVADRETRTQTAAAMAFLRDLLADGPREVEEAKRVALAADVGEKPLRTARERLCRSYRPGGNKGPYFWELRKGNHAQPRPIGDMGIQGHSGAFRTVDAPVDAVDALDAQDLEASANETSTPCPVEQADGDSELWNGYTLGDLESMRTEAEAAEQGAAG